MTDIEKHKLEVFGERLRLFRQAKNLSQEKFAEVAGLDRTYVWFGAGQKESIFFDACPFG